MKTEPVKIINVTNCPLSALDVHPYGGLVGGAHDGTIYHWKLWNYDILFVFKFYSILNNKNYKI